MRIFLLNVNYLIHYCDHLKIFIRQQKYLIFRFELKFQLLSSTFFLKIEIEQIRSVAEIHNKSAEWRIVDKLSHNILDLVMETSKKWIKKLVWMLQKECQLLVSISFHYWSSYNSLDEGFFEKQKVKQPQTSSIVFGGQFKHSKPC